MPISGCAEITCHNPKLYIVRDGSDGSNKGINYAEKDNLWDAIDFAMGLMFGKASAGYAPTIKIVFVNLKDYIPKQESIFLEGVRHEGSEVMRNSKREKS